MKRSKLIRAVILMLLPLAGAPATAVEFVDGQVPVAAQVELGRMLFFDKILSGNENISCATCHHPLTNTGDGLALPIGEGGVGLGVTRTAGSGATAVPGRVPRNAPPVFMLGSVQVSHLFHDGRVEAHGAFPSGFKTPAGFDLPETLANILAAQAMFPVTSGTEMAGQAGENPIADAAAAGHLAGPGGVWERLAQRLRSVPEYVDLFAAAFGISQPEITFAHAANAIAAFEIAAWRADDSPWDRRGQAHGTRLRGPTAGRAEPLSRQQRWGMRLFFGKAGCAGCHSGELFSDMQFHGIAMPQIGPGKGDGLSGREDWGRYQVTGDARDKFRFRTPPLRNVALTAPYGHAGAYDSLEAVVRHHLDPVAALTAYDCAQHAPRPRRADLTALDCMVMANPSVVAAIASANELAPNPLADAEVAALVAFLHSLTDPASLDLRLDVPERVPSGLPVAE